MGVGAPNDPRGCEERRRVTAIVVLVFGLVYLGMILGGLPFVQLDRTGVALLGAIALVGVSVMTPEAAVDGSRRVGASD